MKTVQPHEPSVRFETMSPDTYKNSGEGLTIEYGFDAGPFGKCFIAWTDQGICSLWFMDQTSRKEALESFSKDWTHAKLKQNQNKAKDLIKQIFMSPQSRKSPIQVMC